MGEVLSQVLDGTMDGLDSDPFRTWLKHKSEPDSTCRVQQLG